jgi:hypothetical protein
VDFSQFTDDDLRAELEAMQLARGASLGLPFDGSEDRLLLKIEAARLARGPDMTNPSRSMRVYEVAFRADGVALPE